MLAEGLSEIVARVPDLDLPEGICGLSEHVLAWREELARMRREGDEVCEAQGFEGERDVKPIEVHEPSWPHDAIGIDRALRDLASSRAGRDLELGHLARRSFEADTWLRLGYARFEQYCRERIGMSASSVHARISLARKVVQLPGIEEALTTGRIGFTAAGLVARVACPKTVAGWVERASARTVKHLREEVEAAELVARVEGRDLVEIGPPDEAALEEVGARRYRTSRTDLVDERRHALDLIDDDPALARLGKDLRAEQGGVALVAGVDVTSHIWRTSVRGG